MDMSIIYTVIDKLTNLLGSIATLSKEKRELKDNALRAISYALHETQIYYAELSEGKNRNRDVEIQLSRYWSAAAIPLRYIDEDLAMRCEEKGNYWICPDNWSGDDMSKVRIQLDGLVDAYKCLIKPRYRKKSNIERKL